MRHRLWQSRIAAVIELGMRTPFTWGSHDCCMFAADCVRAVTDIDPAEALRGAYNDAGGAAALLASLGGVQAIAEAHAISAVDENFERLGDVGIADIDGRTSLVVFGGEHWMGPSTDGLAIVEQSAVLKRYRIA